MGAYSSGGMEANSWYDDEAYSCYGIGAYSCDEVEAYSCDGMKSYSCHGMEAYSCGGMEANSWYDDEAYSCQGVEAKSTTGGSVPSFRCQARILTTSLQAAMVAYSSDGLRPTLVMGWGLLLWWDRSLLL